jgi:hypothetical protein
MNFYQLYNLINEYGQNLIQTLTQKFQKEVPTLTPTIIKSYIDRFDRIKNNLTEKDITKYTWKDLENTVDGYQPKQRIKAGKLDPTVSDANLLYNQDGTRIYLGKDKKSCIKYGNGYSFCISARGPGNMYGQYRIHQKGTPYFIFNDKLPTTDNRHLMVLFVYKDTYGTGEKRYSLTLASNRPEDETGYNKLKDIIAKYPWTDPMEYFVSDDVASDSGYIIRGKGTVDVEPFEMIEHYLTEIFHDKNYKLETDFYDKSSKTNMQNAWDGVHIVNILNHKDSVSKNLKKLQDSFDDNKNKTISLSIVRKYMLDGNEAYPTEELVEKFDNYENVDDLISDIMKIIKELNGGKEYEDQNGLTDYIKLYKSTIEEVLTGEYPEFMKKVYQNNNKKHPEPAEYCFLTYPPKKADVIIPAQSYENNTFVIKIFSKNWIKKTLNNNDIKEYVDSSVNLRKEYDINLNWLKQRTPEQTEMILDKIKEDTKGKMRGIGLSPALVQAIENNFAHFKKLF